MRKDRTNMSQDEIKKMRRASYIKMVAMAGFVVAVLAYSSIAWFTMNKENNASGMGIKTSTNTFEIATARTETNSVHHQSLLEGINTLLTLGDPKSNEENAAYYQSSPSKDSIMLRYDTSETEVGPGGNGALSLYVVPKTNSQFEVTVSLNVVPFAEIDKYVEVEGENSQTSLQKSGTEVIEITDATDFASKANAVHNSTAAAAASDYVSAANYIKGHIMFFGGEGDKTNANISKRYYYTTPYTTRTFSKTISAGNLNQYVQVPVFWMWPNTLGQIALPDNVSGKRNNKYPILSDTVTDPDDSTNDIANPEKSLIKTYLKANKAYVFANCGANTETNIDTVTTHVDSATAFNNTAFSNLSTGYNQADNAIGTRIAYFMIEVTIDLRT